MELIGVYFVACGLLVTAGLAKALRPDDTARALAGLLSLSPRVLRVAVRTGSSAEALLGAIALAVPRSETAWLVAGSYLGFAAVITVLRRRGGAIASCGCFGTPDTPATGVHVVIDLVLALSAVWIAVDGPTGSLGSLLGTQPFDGLPLLAASGLCAWLTFLAISTLSQVEAARDECSASRGTPRTTPRVIPRGGHDPGRVARRDSSNRESLAAASSIVPRSPAARSRSVQGSTWPSGRAPRTGRSAPAATRTAVVAPRVVPAFPSSAARSTAATTGVLPDRSWAGGGRRTTPPTAAVRAITWTATPRASASPDVGTDGGSVTPVATARHAAAAPRDVTPSSPAASSSATGSATSRSPV